MRFLLLVILIVVFSAEPITLAQDSCEETGQVFRYDYRSEIISTDMFYSLYLPPCYGQTDELYPVLYLMHGSASDDRHWIDLGLIDALDAHIKNGDMPPMIVVLPYGNWIANQNTFADLSWENVFLKEFLPLVEGGTRADTSQRMIGGISRGGFWAYSIGLRHPEMFRAIGGHSAYFDLYHAPDDFNPLDLALTVENPPEHLYLDRGDRDYASPGLDIMHENLKESGIPHEYIIGSGEHNDIYWSSQVEAYLDFYTRSLSGGLSGESAPVVAQSVATAEPLPDNAQRLILPVVAFPSLMVNLPQSQLDAVLSGTRDNKLLLDRATFNELIGLGYLINPENRIYDSIDAVKTTLWADRTTYALMPFDAVTQRQRVLWLDEVHPFDQLDNYELLFDSDSPNFTPNFSPDRLTRIMATGVTAITRRAVPNLEANGVDWATEAIEDHLKKANFTHTSNEVSIYPTCPNTTGPMLGGSASFCSKEEHFKILENVDIDIVELSGNHNNDYGYEAYLSTLDWYRERGIVTVGGGATLEEARSPLVIAHHGNSVAWVSCNVPGPYYALVNEDEFASGGVRPGAAPCNGEWLRKTLTQLNIDHDVVILTLQYWEFDQHAPTAQQRIDFAQYAQWGADVVIGTQAHFPQTYAFTDGMGGSEAFIHYGLGNLFFDQPWWATQRFTTDELFIYDGELKFVDVFPGIADDLIRPRAMTPEERENFLYVLFVQNGSF